MSARARSRWPRLAWLIAACLAVGVGSAPDRAVAATPQHDVAAAAAAADDAPPLLTLPAFGDVSYKRLAQRRGLDLPVTTSGPVRFRVELVIPASVARTLKIHVGKRQVRAVLARTKVTAKEAGDHIARPRFRRSVAKRLAAKPRHFKLTVRAIAGSTVVSGVVTIKTRD